GPTLRGGRFRPPIGRNMRVPQRRDSVDEEETVGLANAGAYDNAEKVTYEMMEDITQHNEKLETDEEGKPIYHHGEETFGDILTHPQQEFHAHQVRRQSYKAKLNRWSIAHNSEREQQHQHLISSEHQHPVHYSLVLHFRQLRGNQRFVLDHDAANDFCQRLNLTPKEKIQFNGVKDTDGLTDFLYMIKKDFSIKIHHKGEGEHQHHHHHGHHHDPDNHTIEFSDNLYVEFKPKHEHHDVMIPVEATRRPFFQHPEPDLSADIGVEKAASWLELFYDLFFVATLTQFTHSHHIKDWDSLGLYTQWFIIAWWAWCASSLYTARFDTDDVIHHIYRLVEMCAVIGMAGSSEYFLNSRGYVYALKGVLALEYFVVLVVAVLTKSKSRMALSFYVAANLLSIALWASSLVILEKGIHRILWFLGIFIEVLVNVIVRSDKSLSWAASHLAERLGLLTLIVLGENLMGLVSLVSEAGNHLIIVIPNFMAVFIIFGFFFMYFEDFNKEIFLHNKYHQIWVYLHFPLHLCQVAFGIALTDILKIYKYQLIRDNKLPAEEEQASSESHGTSTTSETHDTSTESNSESHDTSTESSSGSQGTSTEGAHNTETSTASTAETTTAEAVHHKVKRAIGMTHTAEDDYNPMEITRQLNEQQSVVTTEGSWPTTSVHWTVWCKYLATSVVISAMHLISEEKPQQEQHHHLMRRSEHAATGSFTESITQYETSFVYKTFLIFAGLILILNSMIKALNTKISDLYGKIIIGSRIINVIILWSMCALPFAQLDAIVLL
ncbi:hypothetical protein CU098_005311, partial [Rhizopus stolonifer]